MTTVLDDVHFTPQAYSKDEGLYIPYDTSPQSPGTFHSIKRRVRIRVPIKDLIGIPKTVPTGVPIRRVPFREGSDGSDQGSD